jgi:hypothetical protein
MIYRPYSNLLGVHSFQVATQGYPAGDENVTKKDLRWVKSYTLAFSNDGSTWNSYQEDSTVKV